MSNTEKQVDQNSDSPQGAIKSPQQLLLAVILAFLVPIAIIVMLVNLVSTSMKTGAGSTTLSEEAIATRLQPIARFALASATEEGELVLKTGKEVYEATCATCHGTGLAGAPKFGDQGEWAPLIKEGFDAMLKIAINGKGAMPAKGGNPSLDDLEVARAVVYMANEAGASFDEPAASEGADDTAAAEAPAEETVVVTETSELTETEAPVAEAAPEAAAPAETAAVLDPAGKKLYDSVCFVCHTAGVAGAPKLGDKNAWAPYIETGLDTMVQKSIHGVGAMPPRGGSQASDEEMKAAVQYMVQEAQ